MKRQIIISAIAILLIVSLVIAVDTFAKYQDKEITLTKGQKDALATKNLTNYDITDSAVTINNEARTSRCITKTYERVKNVSEKKIIEVDKIVNNKTIKVNQTITTYKLVPYNVTQTIRCFNVINGKDKQDDIIKRLDESEKKVIEQEADKIIKQTSSAKTKIGEGKTIIK